jgi:predicted PurR-regulated permease PerM
MKRNGPPNDSRTHTIRHELSLRSIFSVIAIVAGLWLVVQVWPILLLLVLALVLAGTLSPLVAWLVRHHLRRGLALGLVLVALVAVACGLGALIIPAVIDQGRALIASAPTIQRRLTDYLVHVPALARGVAVLRQAQPQRVLAPLGHYAVAIASATGTVVALTVTTLVLTAYFLAEAERVKGFVFALLPRRMHLRAARILMALETVVGGYMRAQALTSLLIGLVVFGALWLAGTPSPLPLAVFAACADVIPLVGPLLALLAATLATLSQGTLPALLVCAAIVIYFQVESQVLVPRIYGQTLRLSPLAVLVALLIGGQLLGIVGALLALPVAASLRVLVEQLRIDLPGEQPSAAAQRAQDAQVEARYAKQTTGKTATEAAAVATALAGQESAADAPPPVRNPSDRRE